MEDKIREVTTASGFTCKVDESKMDDMRLFENIVMIQEDGDTYKKLKASLEIMTELLGEEQKEKLYQHLEKTEGKASVMSFRRELTDIFSRISEGKKK